MMGMIAVEASPEEAMERLRTDSPLRRGGLCCRSEREDKPYGWEDVSRASRGGPLVLVSDYGLKYNILRLLRSARLQGDGHAG